MRATLIIQASIMTGIGDLTIKYMCLNDFGSGVNYLHVD